MNKNNIDISSCAYHSTAYHSKEENTLTGCIESIIGKNAPKIYSEIAIKSFMAGYERGKISAYSKTQKKSAVSC